MDKQLEELDQILQSISESLEVLPNGTAIPRGFTQIRCSCCGHPLADPREEDFVPGYVTCPACSYIQYASVIAHTSGRWEYIIHDKAGNWVPDRDGYARRFPVQHLAEEYIRYCKKEDEWTPQAFHFIR